MKRIHKKIWLGGIIATVLLAVLYFCIPAKKTPYTLSPGRYVLVCKEIKTGRAFSGSNILININDKNKLILRWSNYGEVLGVASIKNGKFKLHRDLYTGQGLNIKTPLLTTILQELSRKKLMIKTYNEANYTGTLIGHNHISGIVTYSGNRKPKGHKMLYEIYPLKKRTPRGLYPNVVIGKGIGKKIRHFDPRQLLIHLSNKKGYLVEGKQYKTLEELKICIDKSLSKYGFFPINIIPNKDIPFKKIKHLLMMLKKIKECKLAFHYFWSDKWEGFAAYRINIDTVPGNVIEWVSATKFRENKTTMNYKELFAKLTKGRSKIDINKRTPFPRPAGPSVMFTISDDISAEDIILLFEKLQQYGLYVIIKLPKK